MIPSKATRSAGALAPFCSFTASFLLLVASASAEQVIFGEVHYNPPTGQPEFIEIHNNTGTPFDIGTWYFSDGIEYTFPDFSGGDAHILKPYERILVSDVDETALRAAYSIPAETRIFGPYTGALSNGGETVTLNNKNGVIMTQLTYNDGGKWPAAADGTGHTLTRINNNLERGEWRNWMSSAAPGGTPGRGPASDDDLPTTTTQITQTTSVWRYDQNEANIDRGTTWREPEFDDGAWPEGPGLFGKNSGDPFATPWTVGGRITYYMRQEFEFNDAFSSATIDIDAYIDDGFVVYLNGQEVSRFNMPAGEINYDTPAVDGREWDDGFEEIARGTDISASLQTGVNVLAVEVHNERAESSDIAFGADMSITATEPPAGSLPDLVISEIHFGDDGRADWVELHTPGSSAIDVAGLSLASLTDLSDSTALTGSVPAGGYASFDVDFPVADNGNINLYLTRGSTVFDAQKFDRDLGEESFQSLPVGEEFYGGPGDTRDAPNNPTLRQTDIVINEIMFDAPSDQLSAEFIELYNRGASAVDLSNWRFTAGVSFDFPVGTSIPANGYLVIAADAACLSAAYGALPVIGDWGGTLRNSGELIRLEDSNGNLVDEVDYKPAGDWPNLADGDGSSMELRHPDMDNYGASAWADSDESNKTTMQEFTYTHAFERASWQPISGAQELHAHLVGDAHVIIEDVSLAPATSPGNNLIVNPTVMSPDNLSSKGWVCQGTHWASFMDSGALNIISDGHGDNKGNLAQVDIGALSFDNIYTLTFKARWVSGKSRVIFQTLDHGFGTTFLLPIPENLGTPGAANSRLTGSSAPAITGVVHSPAVPKPNNPVKISAQVASAEAIRSVKVFYRLDDDEDIKSSFAGADWQQATMVDDGSGLFSASLNQFNDNGDIVQFYVEAESVSDGITRMPPFIEAPPENNPLNSPPIVGPARPAMWIVDSRDMLDENGSGGSLLRERFIISRYDREALRQSSGHSPAYHYNFPKMSNHFFNATFISNESEVYYLAELRKSGSPFTRSSGNELAHGKWKLPGDRLFRGRRRSVFDASGTNEGSGTPRFWDDRIARYFLYQLGHPINEFEFVHWVVNTDNFKLRENHEPISNDMLDRNFPGGADGTLLRIDDEWRFTSDDGTSTSRRNADWSYKDTEQAIRYHSEWILRSREADYDYDNFVEWVRTLETNFDEPTIDRLADADMMCINAAVRGYDADWDTLTLDRGKNGYFFRPKGGNGWMLLHWDGDRVFDRANQAIIGNLAGVRNYFVNKPFIKRRLNYYLTKLLDEHTRGSDRTEAWMQAEEDAVDGSDIESGGSGVTTTASATMNHYRGWFNNREANARNFVTSAVNNTDFEVTTNSSPTQDDTLDLTGTAPPDIFSIRVFFVNQDDSRETLDSEFQWVDTTDWNLAGIPLRSGVNTLVLEGIDHLGNQVEEIDFTITKTTNAPPVVVVETSPKSKNVGLSETLVLDASGSYDPEGSALSYAWQVSPTDGVIMAPAGSMAMASFTVPGLYDFTTTATDDQAQATPHVVGVAVYGPESFSTFGEDTLEEFWDYSNIEKHPNSPNTPYFSLQDNEGRLTINIPLSMRPLGLPQPELPAAQMYVDYGANWSYDESGADLTGTFAQPGFDDGAWPVAPGFIGFGGINQPASFPDPPGYQSEVLTRGLVTYYFRTEFDFSDDAIGSQISINHVVDDGVRYYLNGQVLGSVRLPSGVIDNTTQATSNTNEGVLEEAVIGTEDTPYVDGSSYLVNGTNVLAAEVHNSSAGNSDLVFGARLNVAANPIGNGEVDLDDAIHPWIHRQLPAAEDWTLQTEVRLEKAQFGEFYAGLLVESEENGNAFRYGIGFKDGESVAALRVNPSGTSEVLTSVPAVAANLVGVRLQRVGDQLIFAWDTGENYTEIHRITLTAGLGTTFSKGGIFASTEIEQGLEASFDYAMLIDSTPASAVPLVVSEIMYHPATNSALEFIEIYNASLAEIDLEGFKLIDGEPVDAFTFPAFMLPSGGYGLLVSDQASFTAAYPEVPAGLIIGQWSDGNLGNSGDTITLTDADGALITSFSYDDMAPWPTSPDGEGPSLVIINEQADLNPNLATSWRASVTNGGSPGAEDSAGPTFDEWMTENGFNDPQAEYKTSGLSNLLAYALGRDLAIAVEPVIGDSGGFATFSHRQRLGDSSLVYSVESSTNLIDWVAAGDLTQDGAPVSNGDGTVTITLLSNIPTSGRISTYYRLRVTAP